MKTKLLKKLRERATSDVVVQIVDKKYAVVLQHKHHFDVLESTRKLNEAIGLCEHYRRERVLNLLNEYKKI